jgi:bifunctional non-homologous end joining protein LigD
VLPKYTPMRPTQVREPFHRPAWVYEEKVDGWRILAYKDGTRVRLLSRNGIDHARRFREIVATVAALAEPTLVLDGEVAIFDQAMRSRFDLLRQSDPSIITTPPIYMAFDVLYRTGQDLSLFPLRERRKHLEEVIAGHDLVLPARRLAANGLEAWAQVLQRGYEGMIGKDDASPYEGGRTKRWLKVKVPGWTAPENRWHRARL